MRRTSLLFVIGYVACQLPAQADQEPVSAIAPDNLDASPWEPIVPAGEEFTPEVSRKWLDQWESEESHPDVPIETALGMFVQSKLPLEIRKEAMILALIGLQAEQDEASRNDLVCRLLITPGDPYSRKGALLLAGVHGTSGAFILRQFTDFLLEEQDFQADDEDFPSAPEQFLIPLILRKILSAETVIQQMLLIAVQPTAPAVGRKRALECIGEAWFVFGPVSQEKQNDVFQVAVKYFLDEEMPDELREGAAELVRLYDFDIQSTLDEEISTASLRIVHDPSRSVVLRYWGLVILGDVTSDFGEAAAQAALAVLKETPQKPVNGPDLQEQAIDCLQAQGTGTDKQIAIVRQVAENSACSMRCRKAAQALLSKWSAPAN